jgi:hypothetical protein
MADGLAIIKAATKAADLRLCILSLSLGDLVLNAPPPWLKRNKRPNSAQTTDKSDVRIIAQARAGFQRLCQHVGELRRMVA